MQKNIQLQVANPCHENWDKMTETDKGRFCLSCQKEVIDFSIMTDQQILQQISKASGGFCGKFNNGQLNRDIKENKKQRLTWYKYFIHVSLPALLLTNKLSAQQTRTIGDTIVCTSNQPVRMGKVAATDVASKEKFIIEGKVVDEIGAPIPGASVKIKETKYGVSADNAGNFRFEIKDSAKHIKLLVSAVGFETKEIAINQNDNQQNIVLSLRQMVLGEMGVVVTRTRKKKPVLQQIKDTITNICYKESIEVYPNPIHFGSTLNIDFDVKEIGEYNILVSNISGQPLLQKRIMLTSKNHNEQMSLTQNFSDGLYFVTVQNISSKKIFTGKILVD